MLEIRKDTIRSNIQKYDKYTLIEVRELVRLNVLDPCFCDDVGQYPECLGCQRTRDVLSIFDILLAN